VATYDWSRSQQLGHTDLALESAVGVLLYQMGIAGLIALGVLLWIAFILWRQFRLTGDRMALVAALGMLAVMVNGMFQEEALFAPLAMGLMCTFAGVVLGSTYRLSPIHARPGAELRPVVAARL
jgi:O-antigen ligase